LSVWPEVLQRSVDEDLRPIAAFMMQLGIEISEQACTWYEDKTFMIL
jgi:ribosome assembly protein YihI (activator of Der GTPase)